MRDEIFLSFIFYFLFFIFYFYFLFFCRWAFTALALAA